jgi:hypothetical protein
MMELHKKFNQPPESQNEIFFYQKFGTLIREAEGYLHLFMTYKDNLALLQANSIYGYLCHEMDESMKGVDTVD